MVAAGTAAAAAAAAAVVLLVLLVLALLLLLLRVLLLLQPRADVFALVHDAAPLPRQRQPEGTRARTVAALGKRAELCRVCDSSVRKGISELERHVLTACAAAPPAWAA